MESGCKRQGGQVLRDTSRKTSAPKSKSSKARKTSSNNYRKNEYHLFHIIEKQPPSPTQGQLSHRLTLTKTLNTHSGH